MYKQEERTTRRRSSSPVRVTATKVSKDERSSSPVRVTATVSRDTSPIRISGPSILPFKEIVEERIDIDRSNIRLFERRVILTEAFKIIKVATKFGGKVFGGFVRNVVVPHTQNFQETFEFKDIDLWFKTDEQADRFREAVGNKLVDGHLSGTSMGKFSRYLCSYVKYNTCLFTIDVMVAKKLPVDDFDVNTVTYSLTEDDEWVTDSPDHLVKLIKDKKAVMLHSYVDKVKLDSSFGPKYYQERIERIFTSRGWTVYVPTASLEDLFKKEEEIDKEMDKFVRDLIATNQYDIIRQFTYSTKEEQIEIYKHYAK